MATLTISDMRLILKSRIWILPTAFLIALVSTSTTVSASVNEEVVKSTGTDNSGQMRLTSNGDSDSEPAFSPDGSKIAFSADGSEQTQLTNRCNMNMPGINADAAGCPDKCKRRCESACRSDGNSQSFCQNLCSSDCEAYGGPCSSEPTPTPMPGPTYPTPWVCKPDPVKAGCQICSRMLSPDIGQTYHTC